MTVWSGGHYHGKRFAGRLRRPRPCDCVVPTRHGRNHTAFGADGTTLKLRNAQYADDPNPLVDGCRCYACTNFSRAYLRHLAVADEMLAGILLSLHNIHFLQDLMRTIRARAMQPTPSPTP